VEPTYCCTVRSSGTRGGVITPGFRERFGRAYDIELHPAAFFKAPTIADLALLVETRLIEEIENADLADAVAAATDRLPATA